MLDRADRAIEWIDSHYGVQDIYTKQFMDAAFAALDAKEGR